MVRVGARLFLLAAPFLITISTHVALTVAINNIYWSAPQHKTSSALSQRNGERRPTGLFVVWFFQKNFKAEHTLVSEEEFYFHLQEFNLHL